MTRLLANVVGPEVRVNAVAPGLIDTPWTADFDEVRELVKAGAPLRRTGTAEDVADAIMGLVRSRYVTGQVLLVDGGVSCLMSTEPQCRIPDPSRHEIKDDVALIMIRRPPHNLLTEPLLRSRRRPTGGTQGQVPCRGHRI